MSDDILVFNLGGRERYALPIIQIREIVKLSELNQVPGASPLMLGLTRLRESYVPVVDTNAILFRQEAQAKPLMAVVIDQGDPVALAVHEVSQVMKSPELTEGTGALQGRFVEAVIHDDAGLIQKLRISEVMRAYNAQDEEKQHAA